MSKTAIRIRVRGIELNERTFDRLLPRLAPGLGMVAWWLKPGWVTLQVDSDAPYLNLTAAINQMAHHVGGTARWDGRLWTYGIEVSEQRRAAA